ncbi:hypothetical protein GYMLUDRAFT_919536 [Collybiopsis luxurians FD-317 M1]|uniref:Uncharacterized protein n=1 Tax=Collybiopsis luxurians FD-317 M1 TaxID=944289 RepID=A0A0D0BWK1_9AGAR|nr:hypothetical protein GYMLUDRAFT_919536 [Collybiopsis luxurians FD-317 M1]
MRYDIDSESSSIFTTTRTLTSLSTAPGLGYLSGRAIHRVGAVVVDGIDAIVIRRRLAQIEAVLGQWCGRVEICNETRILYKDLLECVRPIYEQSIRKRALLLIMGKIGSLEFECLASVIAETNIFELYYILKAVFTSIQVLMP